MTNQQKKTRLRNKADRLFQQIGRMLYNKCLIPGCNEPYSCLHHFVGKDVSSALRYNLKNGIPICLRHHCRIESSKDPLLTATIIKLKGWAWYDELQAIRKNTFIKDSVAYYENVIFNLEKIYGADTRTTGRKKA